MKVTERPVKEVVKDSTERVVEISEDELRGIFADELTAMTMEGLHSDEVSSRELMYAVRISTKFSRQILRRIFNNDKNEEE